MSSRVRISTIVKPSISGAKGFLYPDLNSIGLVIKKDTEVEKVPLMGGREHGLAPILVENWKVSGCPFTEGVSLYWIPIKSLE